MKTVFRIERKRLRGTIAFVALAGVIVCGCERKEEVYVDRRDDVEYRNAMVKLADEQRAMASERKEIAKRLVGVDFAALAKRRSELESVGSRLSRPDDDAGGSRSCATEKEEIARLFAMKARGEALERQIEESRKEAKRRAMARREREAADKERVRLGEAVAKKAAE